MIELKLSKLQKEKLAFLNDKRNQIDSQLNELIILIVDANGHEINKNKGWSIENDILSVEIIEKQENFGNFAITKDR